MNDRKGRSNRNRPNVRTTRKASEIRSQKSKRSEQYGRRGINSGRRPVRRHRRSTVEAFLPVVVACLMILVISVPLFMSGENKEKSKEKDIDNRVEETTTQKVDVGHIIDAAELLATGYDYDAAIVKIDEALEVYPDDEEILGLKVKYTRDKTKLVEYKGETYHVFFHQLMVDPSVTFSDRNTAAEITAHDRDMTTLSEFNKMMKYMYKKGFILVEFEDLYDVKKDDKGNNVVKQKTIMLPEGKKPLIISQDDVNFYQKTTLKVGGYGEKYVLDENNNVKVLYVDADGKENIGDYDLLPALETFIQENPKFSYKGARAYIGLTGFDGVFGYRTQLSNKDAENYAEEVEMAKKVADAAKSQGFEFVSHSYAHANGHYQTVEQHKKDIKNWKKEVASIVGDTNVYLIPYGNWWLNQGLSLNSEEVSKKLATIADEGFAFISGVGCDTFRIIKDDGKYVFDDRYNLDGYRLKNSPDTLSIFFDVKKVIDKSRPE